MPVESFLVSAVTIGDKIYLTGFAMGYVLEFTPSTGLYQTIKIPYSDSISKSVFSNGETLYIVSNGNGVEINLDGTVLENF